MSSSANVHSIQALEELRSALLRFKSEAQNALNGAEGEINRTRIWLQERLQYWQNELRRRRHALEEAQTILRACLNSGTRDRPPDCRGPQAAVWRAQRHMEEAEQQLRTVQEHIKRVEEATTSYQHQARHLVQTLDNDLLKGSELLNRSITILQSYISESLSTLAGINSAPDASHVGGSGIGNLPAGYKWERARQWGNEADLIRQQVAKGQMASILSEEHQGHEDARLYYHDYDGTIYLSQDKRHVE